MSIRVIAALAFVLAPPDSPAREQALPASAVQAAQVTDKPSWPAKSLLDTGLYIDGSAKKIQPDNLALTPQYPLWSDGADKSWLYASYIWNEAQTDAVLAPAEGAVLNDSPVPGGRYEVPSRSDCRACHDGAAVPVLGASAVQLARVPDAVRANDEVGVQALIARGQLRNFPLSWSREVPAIAASSETERQALGYLHGNCGHCHNVDGSPAAVELVLAQSAAAPDSSGARVLRSAVNARSRFRPNGMPAEPLVIAPGRPEASVIERRMQSRQPLVQMPPLSTSIPDADAVALIRRWIASDLSDYKESLP